MVPYNVALKNKTSEDVSLLGLQNISTPDCLRKFVSNTAYEAQNGQSKSEYKLRVGDKYYRSISVHT